MKRVLFGIPVLALAFCGLVGTRAKSAPVASTLPGVEYQSVTLTPKGAPVDLYLLSHEAKTCSLHSYRPHPLDDAYAVTFTVCARSAAPLELQARVSYGLYDRSRRHRLPGDVRATAQITTAVDGTFGDGCREQTVTWRPATGERYDRLVLAAYDADGTAEAFTTCGVL